MSLPPAEVAALVDAGAVSYAAVAATAWLVWDAIVHFDVEVGCIWNADATWIKLAYTFMRYGTILHEGAVLTLDVGNVRFPDGGCHGWLAEEGVFMELLALVVETVLVMRLYALYQQNRVILATIVICGAAQIVVMSVAVGITAAGAMFNTKCQILKTPNAFTAYWISSLVFETYLFILTLVVFLRHVKAECKKRSILFVFVRDGTWAYALIFVSLLLNTLMYKLEVNPLAGMGYFWDCSVLSFSGSHILLNIRRLGIPNDESSMDASTALPTSNQQLLNTVLTSVIDANTRLEATMSPSEEQESTTICVTSRASCQTYSPHPKSAWESDSLGAGPSRLPASASP